MEFQMYEALTTENIGKTWPHAMDNNAEEYFNWHANAGGGIKLDEAPKMRKRKLQDFDMIPDDSTQQHSKTSRKNGGLVSNETSDVPKARDINGNVTSDNAADNDNGTSRMPQWQVDDITDLNADIEGSFNGLTNGGDQSNNSFNMSEAILSLSSMAVLKQEAPSPPNDYRNQQHSPNHTHSMGNAENSANGEQGPTNAMLNATIQQLLSHTAYNAIPNAVEANLLNASNADSYFTEDCRFQYVLAAATSIATKINEDTLTYLNQGQSYEIKLKKLGDLSMYRGKLLKSVIKICFHERRLQYMEKEQMTSWQQSRPGDRILEIDVPLSYGLCDVVQSNATLNTVQFSWDPTKEVGAYIKVNCISTEFTPKKHGGEKGVPFRIQVETYQAGDAFDSPKRLHAAACQIKVFKLKGADRKHKQDKEKILKRSVVEQEKYQPSYECTVLNDVPNDALMSTTPISAPFSPESNPQAAQFPNASANGNLDEKNMVSLSPVSSHHSDKQDAETTYLSESLQPTSNPQQTVHWLSSNRFEKLVQTFANFSGADMLRMSRDDLIQICGHADGIRLHNALHSKSIAPKLTLYVCKEDSNVFNAVYLLRLSYTEIIQKLATFLNMSAENIRDVYVQGPHMIHVQLNTEVMKHIKNETMFNVEVIDQNTGNISQQQQQITNGLVVLLKPVNRTNS